MKIRKFLIVLFVILVCFGAIGGFLISVAARFALLDIFLSLTPTAPILSETNILVLGLDRGAQRSDTIMVVHINPEKKTAKVLSVPRDTLAIIPERGLDKINHAFAYGGIELSKKTVENLFQVQIPYFILVDLKGIEKLVDEVGGVTIDVEKRMYYVDYAGDLYIDLKPGIQKLNGLQAMGYLRFRHTDNDFVRIGRQQKFVNAFGSQMMKRENILKSPALFLSLLSCVESNLNSREILGLSLALRQAYETGQISMNMIPGSDIMADGIYYYRPDGAALQKATEELRGHKSSAANSRRPN